MTAGPVGTVTQPAKTSAPANAAKCERVLITLSLVLRRRGRAWRSRWNDTQPSLGTSGHLRVIARRVRAIVRILLALAAEAPLVRIGRRLLLDIGRRRVIIRIVRVSRIGRRIVGIIIPRPSSPSPSPPRVAEAHA